MKYFIATYKIFAGERSDYKKLLIRAMTKEKAEVIGEKQEHDAVPRENVKTWWDYGDGSTIAVFKGVQEVTKEEANDLHKNGKVNYFNPKLWRK